MVLLWLVEQQIRPEDIRRNFGVVHQNGSFFRKNTRQYTSGVDDPKFLIEVSKASGVMDWLGKLPHGFDSELSEGGKELSGGQKQTVALARALMRKPKYMLFDEPTANMDTGTEQQVLTGLKEHLTNETMLIVTHRMAPLSLVDRIIVLDNGRVAVEDLEISNLKITSQNSLNASLYKKYCTFNNFNVLQFFSSFGQIWLF